ncbi:MAG: hypothetical protein KA354_17955 [Phycisphaerae bacterium]|nr:hypothetical protein [Phycisphaerae bacterium]
MPPGAEKTGSHLALRPEWAPGTLLLAAMFVAWVYGPGQGADLAPVVPLDKNEWLGTPPPAVEPADQTFLMRLVRRSLQRLVRSGERYTVDYVPSTLEELRCCVSVTLRRWGRVTGQGLSGFDTVVKACASAAEAALADARRDAPLADHDLAETRIELELIGPFEMIGTSDQPTEELARQYEPPVHGLALRFESTEARIRPSEWFTADLKYDPLDDQHHGRGRCVMAIARLREMIERREPVSQNHPDRIIVLRFRSLHLYEPTPGQPPVELLAGLRLVPSADVHPEKLLVAADTMARFIRFRQNADGVFAYEYLAGQGMYRGEDQNWIRQAATTWSMAVHARKRRDAESARALDRAIGVFRKMIRPVSGQSDATFLATPDDENGLGATALVCLALADGPDPERYADIRLPLLNGLASMQEADGTFRTHFPPSALQTTQDYYPGEALLAIARQYALDSSPRWRAVCDKSLPFYRAYFRQKRPAPFIPWQAQAWGQLARTTRRQEYADFVYEMTDHLAGTQMAPPRPMLPIYLGGFDVYGSGRPGVSSAVYLEGAVDALRTAESLGDRARADRYRRVVTEAARFVLQLQFREEECYYVGTPRDVVGAVRNSPSDPSLRIDHVQHALCALLGAAELLTPASRPSAWKSR